MAMKKPRRRPLRGRPLLVAGAGATVLVAGCAGSTKSDPYAYTSGNLVAPPTVQLCVEVTPPEADATVTASGQELPDADPSCVEVYEGDIQVSATAEGYEPYEEVVQVYGDTDHTVSLTATKAPE